MADKENSKEEKQKRIIQSYIEREGVYENLTDILKEKDQDIDDIDYHTMVELLQSHYPTLFENLLDDLENMDRIAEAKEGEEGEGYALDVNIERNNKQQRQFMFKIEGAQQFNHLLETENVDERVQIFINFLNQKKQSKVQEIDKCPKFDDLFIFDIVSQDNRSNLDLNLLKKLENKLELVVCIINMKTRERRIYALKQIEWRFVLTYPISKMNVELGKYEDEDVRAGVLRITMELHPKIPLKNLLNEKDVQNQLKKEIQYKEIDVKAFYEYSKKWWISFKEYFPEYQNRIIKLYTENEFGMYIPSPSYISPLQNVSGIDTTQQAARFVSLIPLKINEISLGENKDIWMKYQNIVTKRAGDIHDHSTLLCGFLLGFNLDAYVVIGSNERGLFSWVMTKKTINNGLKTQVEFWNPLTGKVYIQSQMQDEEKKLFKKIGCVFNNIQFFANIQKYDYAIATDFTFTDKNKWHKVDEGMLAKIQPFNTKIILNYPTINIERIEGYVEKTLRNHIQDYRMINGMTTRFDPTLESLFKPFVATQELKHIYNLQIGQDDFQVGLRQYLPQGNVTKNVVLSFPHFDMKKVFLEFKNNEQGKQLLHLKSLEKLFFGVKCKLEPYPDNFFVIWISIFVRYKKN